MCCSKPFFFLVFEQYSRIFIEYSNMPCILKPFNIFLCVKYKFKMDLNALNELHIVC